MSHVVQMAASKEFPPPSTSAPTIPVATASAGPQPGESLGRFLVLSRLGQGGIGEVFLAYDPQLSRNVVLKLPLFSLKLAPDEARWMARLSHPKTAQFQRVSSALPHIWLQSALEVVATNSDIHALGSFQMAQSRWVAGKPHRAKSRVAAAFAERLYRERDQVADAEEIMHWRAARQ